MVDDPAVAVSGGGVEVVAADGGPLFGEVAADGERVGAGVSSAVWAASRLAAMASASVRECPAGCQRRRSRPVRVSMPS